MRFLYFFAPRSKMKRTHLLLAGVLSLACAQSFAREPQAPPSPDVDGSSTRTGGIRAIPHQSGYGEISLFVGQYGEAIEIPYYWAADAESRGQTEAVYFHRKYSDDQHRVPFQPKPAEYKPEDFSRLELMELVVIPKNAPGGLRSLAAIRRAKETELARSGLQFKIIDEKNEYAWPRGTFYVETVSPYRLFQTYSESPSEFYIFTVGDGSAVPHSLGEKRAADYDYTAERAVASLRKHLLAVHKKTPGEFWFKPEPRPTGGFLAEFKQFRLGVAATLLTAVMTILSFWPGSSLAVRRTRLFGRSLLLFSAFAATAGFLSVYIPVRFIGFNWRNSSSAELIPILLMPVIGGIAALRFGSARPRRVLMWTLGLSAIFALDLYRGILLDSVSPSGTMAYEITLYLYVLGLVFGLVFALAFGLAGRDKVRA